MMCKSDLVFSTSGLFITCLYFAGVRGLLLYHNHGAEIPVTSEGV